MSDCRDCVRLCKLVGWEDSPWESVSDMTRDLARVLELSEVYPDGTRNHRARIADAVVLLRQSGEQA